MIPKKIYLSKKVLESPKTRDGEPKTMRVKTFPSKGDAEYVDVSQMWHEDINELNPIRGDALVEMSDGAFEVWPAAYLWGKTSIELLGRYPLFRRWMWCKDLTEGRP